MSNPDTLRAALAAEALQAERDAFKLRHKHLNCSEVPDAWGRPSFKHPHVESIWLGWIERATEALATPQPAALGDPAASAAEVVKRTPLPPGSFIEYMGEEAEVVRDNGGDHLTVTIDGREQQWFWEFEGEACKVVSLAVPAAPQPRGFIVSERPAAPVEANNDEVICPSCAHQFRAIPVNVQKLLLASGHEPPFKEPAAAGSAEPASSGGAVWVSVDDAHPQAPDDGDDVAVWTWDGKTVAQDEWAEQFEQPAGPAVGGWISTGFGFACDGIGRQATHWMPRTTPKPPTTGTQPTSAGEGGAESGCAA